MEYYFDKKAIPPSIITDFNFRVLPVKLKTTIIENDNPNVYNF